MFFGLLIGEVMVVLFLVGSILITWPDVPWNGIQWGGVIGMLVLAPALIAFSRVMWLAIDVLIRPVVPEELADLELPT